MEKVYHVQMSESYLVAALLSITGGFQDAYTYACRGGVFANAQTGNIVLAGQSLALGQWWRSLSYIVPILAFVGGVYLAQEVLHALPNIIKSCTGGRSSCSWRSLYCLQSACCRQGPIWQPMSWSPLPARCR